MRCGYLVSAILVLIVGVESNPVALKQTSRGDILRRAEISRTRPKRATTSPGLPPPTNPGQTFAIKFTNTGQSNIDNLYGWSDPNNGAGLYLNWGGTLAAAPVFVLDANSLLVRVDTPTPQYAYLTQNNGPQGVIAGIVTFGVTPPSGAPLVKCTIDSSSVLLCASNQPNTQQTVSTACQNNKALIIFLQGINVANFNCFFTTLYAVSALPS